MAYEHPESVLDNETHEIHWDSANETDHLIPAKTPNIEIMNKKENLPNGGFCSLSGQRSKNRK